MAELTQNLDVDYITKDFNSTVDALVSFATVNFGSGTSANRLWTNFNADSFSRTWLEIVAFVADILFFYMDVQATQAYLQTATVRSSVRDIAKQFGFTPATAASASGTATFTVTGAGTISRGFRVQATNGEPFFVTNDIVAGSAGDVSGAVLQGTIKNESFTAEGIQNEEFDLAGPNVIRDLTNTNVQDISPQITVNGNTYELVTTFIRHNGKDEPAVKDSLGNIIGGGGRVFLLDERPDGTPFIRFGDGVFGRKLVAGEAINIIYRSGGGTAGNISQDTLTQLVDENPIISSVTNNVDFSGGADEQSIDQLRELIPASLRTLERAVAERDYSDILIANFNEVFDASTEPNTTDAGVDLNIYVVPQGLGISKISNNNLLKTRLTDFIDRRKMVTVQFQILDAFGIDVVISLELFLISTASRNTVSTAVNSALEDFFNLTTGGSDGSGISFSEDILLRDISAILQDIEGIERFEIKKLTYKPRISENVIGLTADYNSSDVTIFKGVSETEWLPAAAGQVTEASGTLLFDNTSLVGFSYDSGTGELTYSSTVDLEGVAPGDLFRDGADVDFAILGVDVPNNKLFLAESLSVNTTVGNSDHGSIRNGSTTFSSFKVFKKRLAIATNLSIDSITDNNLNLSVFEGTGTAISSRVLLDNSNTFVPGEFTTGDLFLVDASGNIWEILENDSNTLTTSVTAVNDASITSVASGDYNIVEKLTDEQVVFQGSVFNVQYNNVNTLFSVGAQFSQIGTIGDEFAISTEQTAIGNLGVGLDLISFSSGKIKLNGSPDLDGVNSDYTVIDSSGQLFNVVGVDNRSQPIVSYPDSNRDDSFLLEDSGLGSQVAQGFQVSETETYSVVTLSLKREGNVVGNLTVRIVDDDGGGLPDLSSVVAISNTKVVTTIDDSDFSDVVFDFATPPTLSSGTQYHLVLSGDSGYASSEQSDVKSFENTGLETFTYNSGSGVISYDGVVDLSSVIPGHFFKDGAGTLFKISAVNDADDEVTIASGETVNTTVDDSEDGSIIINDRILLGTDSSSPTYSDGELSRYDGTDWSNSTTGPSQFGSTIDAIFSVKGTKSITVDSNLTPVLGPGATVSERYYDDNNEVSFIVGITQGTVTSATDVNATGRGTVASVPDRPVDTFIFRTSRFADDIVNLRANEIPRLSSSDIQLQIFGGIEN